jgi:Flp pilus assembly pilin Flp
VVIVTIEIGDDRVHKLKNFLSQEDAPTFMEYGLLIIVIALVVVAGATIFGTAVNQLFQDGSTAFN